MDLFLPMLTLGLVTSLHCVSMCGPMVASYAVKDAEEGSLAKRLIPNFAYQGAKIFSYMLVGLILGAIGSAFNLDAIRPYVMLGAGVFMIVLGLGMTGKFPWAARLSPAPPKFLIKALSSTRRKAAADAAENRSSLGTPITFGLLTGLMPCAPLMAAQLNAAAAGSAVSGAIGMFAFGIGTAPLMLGFGAVSTMLPRRTKERAMALLAVVVIVFGLVYLNRGAMLVGSPVNFESAKTAVLGGPVQAENVDYVVGADGVVEIQLAIINTRFVPDTLSLPADQPVRFIVDRQEAGACSDQLAVPQLGVLVDLAPNGVTQVDIPAAPAGTYTLTCGMGMMYGQLQVGGAGVASGPSPILPLMLVGGVISAGMFYKRRFAQAQQSGSRKQPAAATATESGSGLFDFTPQQILLTLCAIGVAVIFGLAAGGLLG